MPRRKHTQRKSIFVSSTFRDMQSERDALRDIVLPRLNEFAAQYGRQIELVDLRWGVDTSALSEEEQMQRVLHTCLDEIERSRPFFLGILGDRYGWVPPEAEMAEALTAKGAVLAGGERSVTELEIVYGALQPTTPPVCFFYFRELLSVQELTPEQAKTFTEGPEGTERLQKLKQTITERFGGKVSPYTAHLIEDEITGLDDFTNMLFTDIKAALLLEWGEPPAEAPTWQEQEIDLLDSVRDNHARAFAGREASIQTLCDALLSDEGPTLQAMLGPAGSGKSALACAVMDRLEDQCLLLPFSCGLSPRTSQIEGLLRMMIYQLNALLGREDDSDEPTTFRDLKTLFFILLEHAADQERVVLVIDALDQLVPRAETKAFLWLRGQLPPNVKLLCTTLDGKGLSAFEELGGSILPVPAITEEDITQMIHTIANDQHKQISQRVAQHILNKRTPDGRQASQNPLYLKLLVQDLVMIDRFEHAQIDAYTAGGLAPMDAIDRHMTEVVDNTAGEAEGAYLAVIERMERLIGKAFVSSVLCLLAASRHGLREEELAKACDALGVPYNPADFSWMRQLLRGHFALRDHNRWDFTHQSLRRALFADRREDILRANEALLPALQTALPTQPFANSEMMHHLWLANRPDIAAAVICGNHKFLRENPLPENVFDILLQRPRAIEVAMMGYTAEVVAAVTVDTYAADYAMGLADIYTLQQETSPTTDFLLEIPRHLDAVEPATTSALGNLYREHLMRALPDTASLPYRIGLLEAALQAVASAAKTDIFSRRMLSDLCAELGDYCARLGRFDDAEAHLQRGCEEAKGVYEETQEPRDKWLYTMADNRLGDFYAAQGRNAEAMRLYEAGLAARESIAGVVPDFDITHSHIRLGDEQLHAHEPHAALAHFNKALMLRQEAYENNPCDETLRPFATAQSRMADAYEYLSDHKRALTHCKDALSATQSLYERSGSFDDLYNLSATMVNYGRILASTGRETEACTYTSQALHNYETLHAKQPSVRSLSDMAATSAILSNQLTDSGDTRSALPYAKKAVALRRKVLATAPSPAARYHLCIALLFLVHEDDGAAQTQAMLEEAIALAEGADRDRDRLLFNAYDQLGDLHVSTGNHQQAVAPYQRAIELGESIYDATKEASAYYKLYFPCVKLGDVLVHLGELGGAKECYQKALDAYAIYLQSPEASAADQGNQERCRQKLAELTDSN